MDRSGFASVSYTHLDVYKRQGGKPQIDRLNEKRLGKRFGHHQDTMWPVSYTHLDVYKRQGFGPLYLFQQLLASHSRHFFGGLGDLRNFFSAIAIPVTAGKTQKLYVSSHL